ncbi:MAG: hypothetical protein R3F43_06780 [bacterium]
MPCHRCHMAAGDAADVPHVKFTDHFIRKKPGRTVGPLEDRKTTSLVDLVSGAAPLDGLDARLRVGLAHTFLWERQHHPEHLAEAVSTLEAVLEGGPGRPRGAGHRVGGAGAGLPAAGPARRGCPGLRAGPGARHRRSPLPRGSSRLRWRQRARSRTPARRSRPPWRASPRRSLTLAGHAAPARGPPAGGPRPSSRRRASRRRTRRRPPSRRWRCWCARAIRWGPGKALGEALQRDITHGPALLRLGLLDLQTERAPCRGRRPPRSPARARAPGRAGLVAVGPGAASWADRRRAGRLREAARAGPGAPRRLRRGRPPALAHGRSNKPTPPPCSPPRPGRFPATRTSRPCSRRSSREAGRLMASDIATVILVTAEA